MSMACPGILHRSPCPSYSAALGGSLLKLLLPSTHFFKKTSLGTWPTIRCGRSEKKTVIGETSCSVRTPSLYAMCFAVCTNMNSGAFAGALVCAVAGSLAGALRNAAARRAAAIFTLLLVMGASHWVWGFAQRWRKG